MEQSVATFPTPLPYRKVVVYWNSEGDAVNTDYYFGPEVEGTIGEVRAGAVVGAGRATGNLAEVRHQVFDFAPNRAGPQHFDSVAHQLVVSAESKRDSSAKHSTCRCKKRCRKGILGAGMNRVGARPTLDRKPGVASFD